MEVPSDEFATGPELNGPGPLAEFGTVVRSMPAFSRRRCPADFGPRAVAFFVDSVVQGLLWFFAVMLSGAVAGPLGLDSPAIGGVVLSVLLLYSLTEVFGAATPGKLLPQLQVARPDGRPASRPLRLRRWAIRNAPLLLFTCCYALSILEDLVPGGSGLLTRAFRTAAVACAVAALSATAAFAIGSFAAVLPARRTLHDFLSGTAIYQAGDVAAMAAEAERGFEPVLRQKSSPHNGQSHELSNG
jgi:uncharacterized RDD family membrane protein YckC